MTLREYWYRVKKHFKFSKSEVEQLVITSLVIGFVFSFQKWVVEYVLVVERGLAYWIFYTVLAFIAVLVYKSLQKIVSVLKACKTVYKSNPKAQLFSVLITIFSFGKIKYLSIGSLEFEPIPELKMTKRYKEVTSQDIARSIAIPAWLLIIITALLNPLYSLAKPFYELVRVLLFVVSYSLLPIPGEDGLLLFFSSRWLYIFTATGFITFTIIALKTQYGLVIPAIIAGAVFTYLFLKHVESNI